MIFRIFLFLSFLFVSGCSIDKFIGRQVTTHGHQFNPQILELVPEGSSREHVLLSLGTPSTTQLRADGMETFYYITQKKRREAAFLSPKIIEQTVMEVAFAEDDTVDEITNYSLVDGNLIAFNRDVTLTGGRELTLVSQLLVASRSVVNPLGDRFNTAPTHDDTLFLVTFKPHFKPF